MSGAVDGRRSIRRTTWPSNRLRSVGCGLRLARRDGLTGFLSLQPSLHRVFREEPPASNENAAGHVLSPGELVADGSGPETQGVGELLDCVQRPHDGISGSGL